MHTPLSKLFAYGVFLAFPAYPIIAATSTALSLDNFWISTPARILLVIISGALLLGRNRLRLSLTSQLLLLGVVLIWAAYISRIAWDTSYRPEQLSHSPAFYWAWALGGCFLPMLALSKQPQSDETWRNSFRLLLAGAAVSVILTLFTASGQATDSAGNIYNSGRLRIGNTLNPIAVGHIGALLLTQAAWSLMHQGHSLRWSESALRVLLIAVGAYVLVLGNSRGPIMAAVCCLLIMLITLQTSTKIAVLPVLLGAAFLLFPATIYLEKTTGLTIHSRIFGQSLSDQADSSMRLALYESALQLAENSPLIGAALEDPRTQSYPHNVFIELYMAAGMIAAVALLILFSVLLLRALKLIGQKTPSSWAAVLFIQFLVGAQVSSAFYSNGYLWCAAGLLIAAQPRPTLPTKKLAPARCKI